MRFPSGALELERPLQLNTERVEVLYNAVTTNQDHLLIRTNQVVIEIIAIFTGADPGVYLKQSLTTSS